MKKLTSTVLAVWLLMGALISCGETVQTPDGETPIGTTAEQTEAAAETEAVLQLPIPSADYGGKEVRLITFENVGAPSMYAEEENGDLFNDVLYRSITATEDHLGVDFTYDNTKGVFELQTLVKNSVAAGDDAFQLVLTHEITGNSSIVSQNLCYDFYDIESIDLTRSYWRLNSYDMLAVNGHIYLTTPGFITPIVSCLTFSKPLMAQYDLEEPYQDVLDGKWTIDRLIEMSKIATHDVNGDGEMDKEDAYGFVSGSDWQLNTFLHSLGSGISKLDETGTIVLSMNTPHTADVFMKLHDFLNNSGDCGLGMGIGMASGRALFAHDTTHNINRLRDCELDYGVIPFPKWDEAQENYTCLNQSGLLSIPATVADPEMVGQTLEMLNFYAEKWILPTYYDVSLQTKSVRDEESIEMLDLIFNSAMCDPGRSYFADATAVFNFTYCVSHHIYQKKTGDFSSFYEKNEKGAQKSIDKFYKAIESND